MPKAETKYCFECKRAMSHKECGGCPPEYELEELQKYEIVCDECVAEGERNYELDNC